MLVDYKDKHYWFVTSNKSGSTFLDNMIQTISENNELFEIVYQDGEWTRKLFLDEGYDLDNFEVIMYGRNPYMRFVSQFYHWWLNPFTHDVHDFGNKWLSEYPSDVVIRQRDDTNRIVKSKFIDGILNSERGVESTSGRNLPIKPVSNKEKRSYMIKFWFAWVQS